MGLIACATTLLLLAVPDDWGEAFAAATRIREAGGAGADLEALADEVDRLRDLANVRTEEPLGQLTVLWLGRIEGRDDLGQVESLLSPLTWPFAGDPNWLLADLLPDGPQRTEAFARALREGTRPPAQPWLMGSWDYGVRCARELLWMEDAVAVQRELHGIYARAWSALNLAGSLQRLGAVEEADSVLASQEALEPNPAEIQNTRGIQALGRGDERAARQHLGRSLARGYSDSALVLARLDLAQGNTPGALAGFRALLAGEEPHAWALRGWGIALLTPAEHPHENQP